jgi:hypothetical protein
LGRVGERPFSGGEEGLDMLADVCLEKGASACSFAMLYMADYVVCGKFLKIKYV